MTGAGGSIYILQKNGGSPAGKGTGGGTQRAKQLFFRLKDDFISALGNTASACVGAAHEESRKGNPMRAGYWSWQARNHYWLFARLSGLNGDHEHAASAWQTVHLLNNILGKKKSIAKAHSLRSQATVYAAEGNVSSSVDAMSEAYAIYKASGRVRSAIRAAFSAAEYMAKEENHQNAFEMCMAAGDYASEQSFFGKANIIYTQALLKYSGGSDEKKQLCREKIESCTKASEESRRKATFPGVAPPNELLQTRL